MANQGIFLKFISVVFIFLFKSIFNEKDKLFPYLKDYLIIMPYLIIFL